MVYGAELRPDGVAPSANRGKALVAAVASLAAVGAVLQFTDAATFSTANKGWFGVTAPEPVAAPVAGAVPIAIVVGAEANALADAKAGAAHVDGATLAKNAQILLDKHNNCPTCPRPDDEVALKGSPCITISGHTDGFGAQANAVATGLAFSALFGIPYRHTQFSSGALMGHASTTPQDMESLDRFLGLKSDPTAAECVGRHHMFIDKYLRNKLSMSKIVTNLREHYFTDDKTAFQPTNFGGPPRGKEYVPSCTTASCDVAVHIRRGDVCDTCINDRYRYIKDDEWTAGLSRIVDQISAKGPSPAAGGPPTIRFHIYSEGNTTDFVKYTEWAAAKAAAGLPVSLDLNLNGDIRNVFHAMVMADAVANGPSSVAETAAMYTLGEKFYFPQRRCSLEPWATSLGCTSTTTRTAHNNKVTCVGDAAPCPMVAPSAAEVAMADSEKQAVDAAALSVDAWWMPAALSVNAKQASNASEAALAMDAAGI